MTPLDYIKNVLVTEATDLGIIAGRLAAPRSIRLLHSTLGIATEIAELFEMLDKEEIDLTNLHEECGDVLWYVGVAVDELRLDFDKMISKANQAVKDSDAFIVSAQGKSTSKREAITSILGNSVKSSGTALDLLKKSSFYGKPLDEAKLSNLIGDLVSSMAILLAIGEYTLDLAMERNIAKLQARYGQKFTEAAAITRDLKTERDILEGKKN
jgi:NTP pyrophosphatase (non-canonical NTP hydrolase)